MSLSDIEFVNPEKVIIKREDIKEDVSEPDGNFAFSSIEGNAKCGEIFTSNNVDFMLCCAFCQSSYGSISEFGEHLRSKHKSSESCFIGECYKSEPEQELVPSEIINIAEDFGSDNDEKLQKNAKYTCKDCNKRYRYKLSFQRHKCRAAAYRKTECTPERRSERIPLANRELKSETEDEFVSEIKEYADDSTDGQEDERDTEMETTEGACELCGQSDVDGQHVCELVKTDSSEETSQDIDVPNSDLFCDICHRQFKYKNVFRRHGMQHEVGPLALRKDPNYRKCVECGLQFTNNAEWLEHETNHPKIKPFQCSYCQKKFKTDAELEAHTKNHTVEGPVKCDQCGADFVRYKNLISHINRVHLQVKPFACTLCDKKFPQNAELRVHMRRHTGEKPYQCEECGQSFMIATKLNEHLKRHAGVRDVQCPVCPMAFVTKKMLRKHMVKHSTERPHVCSTCGNTFSRRKALLAHVKIHMDVKEYVCKLCGKAFAQHAGLYMHKKTHLND